MFVPARWICVTAVLLAGCRYRFAAHDQIDAASDVGAADDLDATTDTTSDATDCGHTFCDNFDRAGPVEVGWDMFTNANGGTAALVTDQSISPPQSLRVTVPTDGTTLTGNAFLKKQLPLATTKIVVHMQMSYSVTNTNNTEADLVALKWDTLPTGCTQFGYYLVRDGTKPLNLQETYGDGGTGGVCAGGSVQNYTLDLDNQPFMDTTLEITFGPMGTAWLKLTVDGSVLVDKAAAHPIAPSQLHLEIGGGVSRNGLAPWTIRYDDLTVDLDR